MSEDMQNESQSCDFKKCPLFLKAENGLKRQENILEMLSIMRKGSEERHSAIMKHMDEEETHHKNVNDALLEFSGSINKLLKDKKKRDKLKDKRDKIKNGVYIGLSIAFIIASYNFFIELLNIGKIVGVSQ